MQIVKRTDDGIQVSVLGIFQLLWSKIILIVLSLILGGAIAYIATYLFITPQYRSSVTMYVNNKSSSDFTSVTSSDLNAAARLVDTYEAIISGGRVLDTVIEEGNLQLTPAQLKQKISVSSINNTEVFQVAVMDPNAEEAARLVQIIAEVAVVQIGEIVEGSSVKIINNVHVPTSIASPNYMKMIILGAAAGVFLCVLIIIIRALSDTRIKGEADLENWDYPVLGVIPEWDSAKRLDDKMTHATLSKGDA